MEVALSCPGCWKYQELALHMACKLFSRHIRSSRYPDMQSFHTGPFAERFLIRAPLRALEIWSNASPALSAYDHFIPRAAYRN